MEVNQKQNDLRLEQTENNQKSEKVRKKDRKTPGNKGQRKEH